MENPFAKNSGSFPHESKSGKIKDEEVDELEKMIKLEEEEKLQRKEVFSGTQRVHRRFK